MKKVLVVEDDKKIAKSLEIRLRSMGCKTYIAYDAVMGINSAVKHNPDLVIMDINMPAGNGLSAAKSMHNISSTCSIPIIFITASKKLSHREQALELGAVGFFEKPYDIENLLDKVNQVI